MNYLKTTLFKKLFVISLVGIFPFFAIAQQINIQNSGQEDAGDYLEYIVGNSADNFGKKSTKSETLSMPSGTNPFVSQGLESGDLRSWRTYLQEQGKLMSAQRTVKKTSKIFTETESPGEKTNNSKSKAERISGFGSKNNAATSTIIQGTLGEEIPVDEAILVDTTEDNSFIAQATFLPFTDSTSVIKVVSELADIEKNGQLSGDLDLYGFDLLAGETMIFELTPTAAPGFNPFILILNSSGILVDVLSAPVFGASYEAAFNAGQDDQYYAAVVDINTLFTLTAADIDIVNTDVIYPLGVNSSYEIVFAKLETLDLDFFQIPLNKGDVFGIAATNSPYLVTALIKPDGSLGIATPFYGIFPNDKTPLPLDGNVGFHYIAPEDGTYTLVLQGQGDYSAEVDVQRPGLETERRQYIYLDFTGVTDFTLREFNGTPNDEVRTLSPLSAFLTAWDIDSTRANTVRLAKKITDVVKENLKEELKEADINPNLDVRIISDFGIDRLGERLPGVLESAGIPYSRVIVGGTIAESGIRTIGIANAIDVGNYSVADDALTLLDVLSTPGDIDGDGFGFPTINNIPFSENVTKMDLVAEVVGNVTSHEAGHYLGNFHTTGANTTFSIMDEGGFGIFGLAGLVQGATFGEDDININFAKDVYSFRESFVGLDETDVNTAFALSTGRSIRKSNDPDFYEDQINALEAQAIEELYALLPSTFFSYPSPVTLGEISRLVIAPEISGKVDVELYDIQGRKISKVFEGNLEAGEPVEISMDFATLNLKSGFYVYKMISKSGEKTHSIIVK